METVGFYSSSNDQKIFPSKSHFAKTQKKRDMNYQYSFISRPSSDNFWGQAPLRHTTAGGLILQRRLPPHDHIYPPFSLPQQQYQEQQQKQPPLLPLPLPHTRIQNPDPHPHPHPRVNRSLSCQPTNRKNRNDSLTTTPKKYSKQQPLPTIAKILKPTAKDIEEQVRKMYNSSISGSSTTSSDIDIKRRPMKDAKEEKEEEKVVDDFSGSVAPFRLSPSPSSLPLPTFSLRPKHMMRSCNVEASGFDAGATDKLQRLLRLN